MEKAESRERDIDLLIVCYLSGSATENDLSRLQEWISESRSNLDYFNNLKNAWSLSGLSRGSAGQASASWNKLKDKISSEPIVDRLSNDPLPLNKSAVMRFLKVAASWIIIFGLGSSLTLFFTHRPGSGNATSSNRTIMVSTPLGARSMIKLPDSSIVWLNAGTTVSYKEDYGQQTRSLDMTGEAYFSVAKDKDHPFTVNTEGIVIRALGTKFNVKAYPEEKTVSATLEEGNIDIKVTSLTDKDASVLLKPKDKFIYHKEAEGTAKETGNSKGKSKLENTPISGSKEISLVSNVRTELYTSWKDPRWIIFREPLMTLAPMLERRYNLKILFDDEQLKQYKFTGIVENETVDQILNALKLTAPLDYRISRDTIRLILDSGSKESFKRIMTKNN
jgi:transmembrane sensor